MDRSLTFRFSDQTLRRNRRKSLAFTLVWLGGSAAFAVHDRIPLRDHPGAWMLLLAFVVLNAWLTRAQMRWNLLTLSPHSMAWQGILFTTTTSFADVCLLDVREKPSGSPDIVRLLSTKGTMVAIAGFENMETITTHLDASIPATAIRYRKRHVLDAKNAWVDGTVVAAGVAWLIAYVMSGPDVRQTLSLTGPVLFLLVFVLETWRRERTATRLTSLFARRPSPLRSA